MMERRTFLVWAAVALLWANLPYLIGYAASTPTQRFGGFFLYEQDGNSYLAKMRQGARGAWDFHLPYTSEDEYQSGGIAYEFYLILGKLHIDPPLSYHAARLLSSILLLMVLRRFIARFISDRRWQLWTWWLLLFSGGWGLLVSYLIDPRYVAYELIAPDAFIFSILYGPPHVIFGFALLLIWIGYTLETLAGNPAKISGAPDNLPVEPSQGFAWLPRRLIVANVLGGLTALSREAYGPMFAGIFAAYLIALTVQHKHIPWREAIIIALASITAGIYSVYLLIAFRSIPGFVIWSQQNPFASPSLIDFVIGFAPLLILALVGILFAHRHLSVITHHSSLITAWLFAGPILAYLPLPISRRLIAGWQIPLCIFGAYALMQWMPSRRPLRVTLAVLATVPSTFLIIVGGIQLVRAHQPPLYQTADQLAALDWLGRSTTNQDVILSDWQFGNLIPVYADARVFIGHPFETAFFTDKEAAVQRFFDPNTSNADRLSFLNRWRITLVVTDSSPPLDRTLAFQHGKYSIYRTAP